MMPCSRSIRRLLPLPTIMLALAGAILIIACGNSGNGDGSGSSGFPADVTGAAVAMEWVIVGDPGNAADDMGFGAVGYEYRISKFEVTNAQYTAFLNAVASSDTNGLYHPHMGNPLAEDFGHGGIMRSGISESFAYSTIAGREDMPVSHVTFWNATRFANWLHNEQPTGAQENTTTEDGAYTLTADGVANNTVTRKAEATVFIPTEDEWYKAAYYDTASMNYSNYPAAANQKTTCALPGPTANTANCGDIVKDVTNAGSYTGSAGPNGTFDQGGNVIEWNETALCDPRFGCIARVMRGGGFETGSLHSEFRDDFNPGSEDQVVGFRVASLPEPAP